MRKVVFVTILLTIFYSSLNAKGAAAGTHISNIAYIHYSADGRDYNNSSNTVIDVVDQLIDVYVSFSQNMPTYIESGDRDQPLAFKVTNVGNGADKFTLYSDSNNSVLTNSPARIYIDTNNNNILDLSSDLQVVDINLSADESVTVFVVNNIIDGDFARSSRYYHRLKAVSFRGGSGIKATLHNAKGVDGVNAIDGLRGGVSVATGIYEMLAFKIKIDKSIAQIQNSLGEPNATTGAVIVYSLEVYIDGSGEATDILISDQIPDGMKYVSGSLKLNSKTLSDSIDSDDGDFDGRAIHVNIAKITDSDEKQIVTFATVIQ